MHWLSGSTSAKLALSVIPAPFVETHGHLPMNTTNDQHVQLDQGRRPYYFANELTPGGTAGGIYCGIPDLLTFESERHSCDCHRGSLDRNQRESILASQATTEGVE